MRLVRIDHVKRVPWVSEGPCEHCEKADNERHIIDYEWADGSRLYVIRLHLWCVHYWLERRGFR